MKTEIAVLSGKEPFGVRIELSVEEARLLSRALEFLDQQTENPKALKRSLEIDHIINSVKSLNQQQQQITQPNGKAKHNG
jgi:hypothetical protein